jgi:DNA-binding response OmpR family regulator
MVLIVEHDTWLRLALANLFEEIGFTVATASNGFGGLQKAIQLQPEVVVIGSSLPEVSSSQLAHEVRAMRHRHQLGTHVILTSELPGHLQRPQWQLKDPPLQHPRVERIAVAV